ncbi:SAV_2336 N-terminal domain-related protein [Kitasatospora sp. NPDC089509]|uniref:SAV_2336 N-terminal domain-related protein n=1 Tax=Kitasatospora sp. NPDC089509 TaxID=3364079 RepID=UPI0037F7BBEE
MDEFGTAPMGDSATGRETPARSVLRRALAALVAPEGEHPHPQDLADVLWISRLAGLAPLPDSSDTDTEPAADGDGSGRTPDRPGAPRPDAPDRTGTEPGRQDPPTGPPRPDTPEPPAPKVELHPRCAPADPTASDGTQRLPRGAEVVQVTRPTALPGALAIARALRPLRHPLTQRPGGVRPLHLDEEATAAATAEAGVLMPVWQRDRPRHSVDLLVDTGATMAVWHDLAGELATLLERHGAFEEVRTWSLGTDGETPHLTPFRRRGSTAPPPAAPDRTWSRPSAWSRPLADPHGRRILFVLTDGVGPAWYGPELVPFLARTAATGPAAALQVLPRRLWHRTALRPAPVEARPATHGRPVPVLRTDTALPGIPRGHAGAAARAAVAWLPLLEIDADWLAPWADLTAGRTTGWTPMLAAPLSGVPRPQRPRARTTEPRPPADRVAAFRAGSSPTAYRLACHLAAAPLSLPVMRLVQRATVPESGQRELAELFLSGLIEVRTKDADPDEVVYDFVDGVRAELLGELTRTESVRVLDHVLAKVSGRVAATFGGTLDFRALAASAGEGRHRLPERSLPFAEVAAAVLAGAGGQHVAIARNFTGLLSRPTVRRELLTPPPPIVSPPDPPRMIGRRKEFDRLTLACDPAWLRNAEPPRQLVVVDASLGMGRRRFVQEYVQRHGGRHSFVHWIEARNARAVEDGFGRLRAALSRSFQQPEHPAPLTHLIGRHPEWLVVIDGLASGLRSSGEETWHPELLELADSRTGCLIVTTESGEVMDRLGDDATVITLGFLTEAELREEIRHRLGDAYQRIEHAQEFQHLLDRMPRRPDELATWHLDEKLAVLVGPARSGDSYSNVRSFPLPSPALAMATVPNAYGLGSGYLAVYGADGLLRYLDVTTGQLEEPSLSLGATGPGVVAMAEISDRPSVLCTAEPDGGFVFWDARDGSFVSSRQGRPEPPVAMAPFTHADGTQYLWTADGDGRMHLWNPWGSEEPLELPGLSGGHRAWALTALPGPGGRSRLVGVDPTGRLHRWRPDDPSTVESFPAAVVDPARARTIVGITGDQDRCVIASIGDRDTHVHIWEFEGRWRGDQRRVVEQPLLADRFRLVQRIAQGRQSEIWRARDERDGSTVAVKTFDRDRLATALDTDAFLAQSGRLAELDHHGLVGCHTAGIDAERLYLVLEFIDNPDLRTVLEAGPAAPGEAAAIAHGVAEALDYLHTHGIAHGRIEPANVLLRPDGSPALCDFGIDLGGAGAADPADDLYALGNLLQQTGVPEPLQGLALELLHPDPRRRPSSAAEVARRIAASGALREPDRTPSPPLTFTLLGEVRVWRGEEQVAIGSPGRAAVLAALLKYRGRPVRAEVLIEAVHEQHRASGGELEQMWLYVSDLQRVLNSPRDSYEVLEQLSDGHTWVLNVASEQIDAVLFERALERAEAAVPADDPDAARRHAGEALALWQGTPLADLPGPLAELERDRLSELYERAEELRGPVSSTAPGPDGLRYSLLGSLRIWRDEHQLPLGSPQQQAVLTALLLHAPEPVPTTGLVNAVWGDQQPPQAIAELRTYISRIRHVLGDRSEPRGAAEVLQPVGDGYRLTVAPWSVDVAVLEERLAAAATAEQGGDLSEAHRLLRFALDLWDGPALDGVPGPYAAGERARFTERRMVASEDLYATGLALGRHEELRQGLEGLVAATPLRERLCALLMLARYRCGLKDGAVEVYSRLQSQLREDFAIEPSPMVTQLYRMIQQDDPELRSPGRAEALIVPLGGPAALAVVDADRLPRGTARQGVAIGLDIARQSPVFVDFDANPLFVVFGEDGAGRTTVLRLLVKQLTERYTSDQVGFLVADVRGSLLDEVPPEYLVHYASDLSELTTLVRILRVAAASRTPGDWQLHKRIFLVVNDFHLSASREQDPLSALTELLPLAPEIGLRVIVACTTRGASRAGAASPFLRTACELGPHGVVLSGNEEEGPLLGLVTPRPLPPGRGTHVTPENPAGTLIQTGWLPPRRGPQPA